ncbi:hypothetical protein BDZ91DRAFT_767274 [Kalaharituber pfeilii]|nr:hypothetical protein BDZ91DRAFT_767274 [Kalaharituber pfeilii]
MPTLQNHCLYVLLNDLRNGKFHWAFYIPELIPTLNYAPTLSLGNQQQYHHLTGMRKGDIYHVTNYLATQPWTRELGVLLPKSSFDSDATLVLAVKIADFSSEGGLGRHSWNRRRFIQVLEKIAVGEDCMYGEPPEPFSCTTWSMEVVRRLSSWEIMGGEGPVLECDDPLAWYEEILEWGKQATAQCAGVMGEVVIKESTKCRVWKSKREGADQKKPQVSPPDMTTQQIAHCNNNKNLKRIANMGLMGARSFDDSDGSTKVEKVGDIQEAGGPGEGSGGQSSMRFTVMRAMIFDGWKNFEYEPV